MQNNRRCNCNKVKFGQTWEDGLCWLCWLYWHDKKYNKHWGGDGAIFEFQGSIVKPGNTITKQEKKPCNCKGEK